MLQPAASGFANMIAFGQVESGKKSWAEWTPVAGRQFEYGFDDIGNRTSTKAGGDSSGAGLRSASYTANNLNQYTSRDIPGAVIRFNTLPKMKFFS